MSFERLERPGEMLELIQRDYARTAELIAGMESGPLDQYLELALQAHNDFSDHLDPFQDAFRTDDPAKANTSEILYMQRGAHGINKESRAASGMAQLLLTREFGILDGDVEICDSYNPADDGLILYTSYDEEGTPWPDGATHLKTPERGEDLESVQAIKAWGKDPLEVIPRAGFGPLLASPRTLEVIGIAAIPGREAAALPMYATVCTVYSGMDYYAAMYDEGAVGTFNNMGSAFEHIEELPHINYNSLIPGSNSTSLYVADVPAWHRRMPERRHRMVCTQDSPIFRRSPLVRPDEKYPPSTPPVISLPERVNQ